MASIFSGRNGRLAANWAQQAVNTGYNNSMGYLGEGYNEAKDAYGRAGALYDPVAADYGAYSGMYRNALGLGGQPGSDTATSAFRTTNPGYQFAYDQGMQALNRAASAGGRLASGGAMMEAQKYGTGLADQTWQKWLDNLMRGSQQSFQGIQGQSQAQDALARNAQNYAQQRAALETDTMDKTASIGMSGFKAGDTAAANRFGAVMGGLNLLSNLGGSIFGGFKGGGSGSSGGGSLW